MCIVLRARNNWPLISIQKNRVVDRIEGRGRPRPTAGLIVKGVSISLLCCPVLQPIHLLAGSFVTCRRDLDSVPVIAEV